MAVTCEILNIYDEFGIKTDEEGKQTDSIILSRIKWGGRKPKGFDIRHYNKEEGKAYKGISIEEEDFEKLILSSITNGLVDLDKVKEAVRKTEDKLFDSADFFSMFNKVDHQTKNFIRDEHGTLRNKNGRVVIERKGK